MKKNILIFSFIVFFSCKSEVSNTIINNAVVQDYSNLFSINEVEILSKKIIDFEKHSTNQICVYTLDSIPKNETISYHALGLANILGVGTKETNNGLLILISKFDKKMAISTGIGTEKIITDSIAKSIIDYTIMPKFKNKLYFEGVTSGLDSIIKQWQ